MSIPCVQRATIFDNGDDCLHVTLQAIDSPPGGQAIIITSQKRQSRHPREERVKFLACLDREGLVALGDLIQRQLAQTQPAATQPHKKAVASLE